MSDTEQAFSKIESMIVIGQLAPGSLHTEAELVKMIGLGRTPIREALLRLAHEGMVNVLNRRGVQIPPVSAIEQMKLLDVRRVVQTLCVKNAARNANEDQRTEMLNVAKTLNKAATETKDRVNFLMALRDAHRLLVVAADNAYLTRAMRPVQGLSRRFWFCYARASDYQAAAQYHADVLTAVAAGDIPASTRASNTLMRYLEDFTRKNDFVPPVKLP